MLNERDSSSGKSVRSRRLASAALSLLITVSLSSVAYAQEAASEAPSPADTDSNEIVVTAQKREQSINDVGMTVTAVSGDALRDRNVTSLDDIAQLVPGLSYSKTQNDTPVFTLRGVGFYDTSLASYPTVSVYLDEIPLPFPVLARHSAFDLERVEILKGPQGTLFGQNATGGAVNYIAAKPTASFEAGLDVGYGRFNELTAEGFVSGPITDALTFRLAGRTEHADGWQYSVSRPGDRNGKTESYMGRMLLNYDAGSGLRLNFSANGWKDKGETQAPQFIALFPSYPVTPADGGAFDFPFTPFKSRAADWTPGVPYSNNSLWQLGLRGEIDLNDDITLTSLTSYTRYKQRQGTEGDGLPIETLDLVADRGRIKSFAQELRLSNGGSGSTRWVIGANYEKSTVNQSVDNRYGDSFANIFLGNALGYPIASSFYTADQKLENYAFFGNAEQDLGQFVFKAGVRYTNADRTTRNCISNPLNEPSGTGDFFYDILLGGAYGQHVPGSCFSLNQLPDGSPVVDYLAAGAPGEFRGTLNEDNLSWRVGIDWSPNRDTLLYANVSRGYKAGAFPTTSASTFAQYLPVTQESVLAYEAGFKLTLIDRTLQLNGAAYYYDYTDKQLRSKLRDPVFALLDVIQNIPKSEVKGFELEAVVNPSDRLTVAAAFTYTDAKVTEFAGVNASGVDTDFTGSPVPFTPKYQVAINSDYRFPISNTLKGFVGGSLNFRSATFAVVGGEINPVGAIPNRPKLFGIESYALVDLRAGVQTEDERWRIQIWGKNVTNQYYWNNVVSFADVIARYSGDPATYGVTVGYRW
jgi:iron complex outermembrane receptor protein